MNFIKTQKLLSQQAGQTEIPLESVLELMRTYLTELRYHTNTPVDRCRIGNMSQLVASLAAVSNDILFVYRTNEKAIHAEENRFTQALAKAQNACGQYHSRITELDEQFRREETIQKQLEVLLEQENSRSAALTQLRQKSAALQAQIDDLRSSDPETEAGKLKTLLENQTAELGRVQEEYAAMDQAHSQNQKKLEEENTRLAQLRTEVDAGFAKLKETAQIIKDQQDIRKELEQEYCKLEHQVVTLKNNNDKLAHSRFDWHDKIDEAQAILDQTQGEVDLLRSLLTDRQTKLEALNAQYAQDKTTAQELEAKHTALEAEHTALVNQITTLEQAIQTLTATLTTQRDQRIVLDDRLEQLEAELGEILRLRQEQDDKVLALDEALRSQQQAIAAVQAEINGKETELSCLTAAHQDKADQLTLLNTQIQALEAQLQQLQEEISLCRTQIAAAEENLKAKQAEFALLYTELTNQQTLLRTQCEEADLLHQEQVQALEELEKALAKKTRDNTVIQETLNVRNADLTLQQSTHQEKAAQLAQLNADIQALENALQAMQEETSLRRTLIAASEEALEAERHEFDALVEQLVTVNVELDAQKTDNENFRITQLNPTKDKLAAQVLEARKDREQLDEIRNSIKLLVDNRTSLAQETALLMVKQKSTQSTLDAAQTKLTQIQTIVAELEEQLRIKGAESTALLAREKELRELLDEKNVARITAELDASNKKLEEDIRKAEQKEQELAGNQQKLRVLQQKLAQVQAELDDCRSRHNDLLSRHESASLELNRITCEENRRRCETLHNQLLMMQAMTEQLMSHAVLPCGQGFDVSEQLNDRLYQAECTVTTLRKVILEYTTMRQNTLENCE